MFAVLKKWFGRAAPSASAIDRRQWARVERGLPFLGHLAADERERLRGMALEFIGRKEWHGAQGLRLTPEIQLAIALQACLPVLNLGLDSYRGWVGVIVYPGDFVIPRSLTSEDGVVHEFDDEVAGEAWQDGPVLLSWFDGPEAADGMNVVIHEFAHKLDMLNGPPDGLPPLHEGMHRQAWLNAFAPAYADFCARVEHGEETWIDPYAAEDPAEFFAVASEVFFEAPARLRDDYPAVYAQLCQFYRQDPAQTRNAPP
ncbi:MAG: zinc-dependent peptidase [Zoogloeaceae bacterium]|jgi:Mlc titration factor MtfA (ptsG expression regulator)|nr:zinc-dependent peptidase [Zoogloeaceae bacterium]